MATQSKLTTTVLSPYLVSVPGVKIFTVNYSNTRSSEGSIYHTLFLKAHKKQKTMPEAPLHTMIRNMSVGKPCHQHL